MPSPTVETLAVLCQERDELDAEIAKTIKKLRKMSASWDQIAKALGVSRQSAHQKYAHLT